jgi:hypothetical protein
MLQTALIMGHEQQKLALICHDPTLEGHARHGAPGVIHEFQVEQDINAEMTLE